VPTFDLGRKAGLGLPILDTDLTAANALVPAWSVAPTVPAPVLLPVLLPVYYHWEFRTGRGGDFESLARRLTPGVPQGLGKRAIDISQPGFAAAGATTADLEGALLPIATAGSPTPVPLPLQFQVMLAGIINESSRSQAADPHSNPLLAPPIYGRWHAGRPRWRQPGPHGSTSSTSIHAGASPRPSAPA
jgi:hypothetical protein